MQVYLVRHTTPAIAKGICYGQSDVAVDADLFNMECDVIRSKLPEQVDMFYSSPLRRCLHLAEALSANITPEDLLLEMNFGGWEMQPWKEIPAEPLSKWMADFVHEFTPGGENYIALHQRTKQFMNWLHKQEQEKVAIVTHAGNIRSFISLALGLDLEKSFRINLNYGVVVHLTLNPDEQTNLLHL